MQHPNGNAESTKAPLREKVDGQSAANDRLRDHRLMMCRSLPEPIWNECFRRFFRGETVMSVTQWLLTVPNRGGLQQITKPVTLQRYMQVFRDVICEMKKRQSQATADSNGPKIKAAEVSPPTGKIIAIDGVPPGTTYRYDPQKASKSALIDKACTLSTRDLIDYIFTALDEQLGFCRYVQGIVQRPIPEATEMARLMCKVAHMGVLADAAEVETAIRMLQIEGSDKPGEDAVKPTTSESTPTEQAEDGSVPTPPATADSKAGETIRKMGEPILGQLDRSRVKLMDRVKQLQSRSPVAIDKNTNVGSG